MSLGQAQSLQNTILLAISDLEGCRGQADYNSLQKTAMAAGHVRPCPATPGHAWPCPAMISIVPPTANRRRTVRPPTAVAKINFGFPINPSLDSLSTQFWIPYQPNLGFPINPIWDSPSIPFHNCEKPQKQIFSVLDHL